MKRSLALLVVALAAMLGPAAALPSPPGVEERTLPSNPTAGEATADPCPAEAPLRAFDVVAIEIPVSYNHWGDFDPRGRLFVLAEQELEVRADVAAKLEAAGLTTAARVVANPTRAAQELGYSFPTGVGAVPRLDRFDVSALVQPLVVRAHLGDCVEFRVTNKLPEPVSLHVHRAVTGPGSRELGGQPPLALPGETQAYRAYVPPFAAMEGAHYLHSHADARFQTKHGLFGVLVAEKPGTGWLAPDGGPSLSGQEAIITNPAGSDHREYALVMHDEVELLDRSLNPLPILSPYGEYGPGTKAMNLRAEPFMDRFLHHDERGPQGSGELARGHDKSMGYSSYTYGEPATFVPRAYVGDPSVFRLVNAGPGQHHVFHLHGGGDRWRASPVSDDPQFDIGLTKDNPVPVSASERIDVQNIGPGEAYNLVIEGGAGGVQASVGDFLFHCHIVEHYVAGMASFWRVYNTGQAGLAELPDRAGRVPEAVDSLGLLGRVMPDGTVLDASNVRAWIEARLPPPGVPGDDDASAWDWVIEERDEGPLYRGEPEDTRAWPNYASPAPGQRPALTFNPDNGRLAYPWLSPHIGKRPPFAPGHGPAPYLGPEVEAGRPDGLCPADARSLSYNVVALSVPVAYNDDGDVDPDGQVFALAEDKAALLAGQKAARSLVLRANRGDCVDVLLTSALAERPGQRSKVNIHIHLVQFDVQASDGVIVGQNPEQSVRPAARTGTSLLADAAPGDGVVQVASGAAVRVGTLVGLGLTEPNVELRRVVAVAENQVTLDAPLTNAHAAGERVGSEFVRYRWYADVEVGIVFFHDHVDGLNSWRHGLFGSLVVEPAGSEWRDPTTGLAVREGPVADIVSQYGCRREVVLHVQDRSAQVAEGRELASIGLRSAPFDRRTGGNPLSSAGNGDPDTPLLRAYPGDPVALRILYTANANTRAVGTFAVAGLRFPFEPRNPGSRLVDAVSFGISSQHNLFLDGGAGGPLGLPGDYLYHMTQPDLFERGAWGIVRVHAELQPDLLALPDRGFVAPGELPAGPVRRYEVVASSGTVAVNARTSTSAELDRFRLAGEATEAPLVLRALPGEVVEVELRNDLDRPVSLHAGLLAADPGDGLGVPVGRNPDTTTQPGATRTYRWYADREVGAGYLTSFGDPAGDALAGLYGAVVVEPAGSIFTPAAGPSASLLLADGSAAREHVLLYASDDPVFMGSVMPYTNDVQGLVTVNYRSEPLAARLGGKVGPLASGGRPTGGTGIHTCDLNDDSCSAGGLKEARGEARNPLLPWAGSPVLGEPQTPRLDAVEGQRLVVRALGGAGDQLHVHGLDGHAWPRDPGMQGSEWVDAQTLGTREALNAWTTAGLPGDYRWGSAREAFAEAGAWGLLRVEPAPG